MHPRARWVAGMLGVVVAILAATAAAVDVRGSVTIPPGFGTPAASTATRQFYWEEWNGFLDPRPARFAPQRELAVVLLGEALTAPPSEVRITGGDLTPATIAVKTGTQLRIVNTDACAHELFAEGAEIAGFGPLQTAPGNARQIEIPNHGHFVIRDRLYAHVEAHVHAIANLAAIGNVARDGTYTFPALTAGTYTLKVFYREHEVGSQQVEVPDQREFAIDPIQIRTPAVTAATPAAPAAPAPAAPAAPAPAAPAAPAAP
jgi:hypothetical protein